jgi:endonuclease YncB( thermonuclease family)
MKAEKEAHEKALKAEQESHRKAMEAEKEALRKQKAEIEAEKATLQKQHDEYDRMVAEEKRISEEEKAKRDLANEQEKQALARAMEIKQKHEQEIADKASEDAFKATQER